MAQAGFTPIQLYRTTTASAQPTAGNLAAGELAINLTDKKLYAKDASNNVFLLADASSGGTTAANLAGGAAGSLPYQSGANATTFLGIGAADRVLTSSGTAPQWVTSLTGLTGVSSSGLTNTSLTSGRLVYSTTGGAQTDSANLTFNGTTLGLTGSLSITGDTITANNPVLSATQTWNNAAVTFTGWRLNVTDTASAAASLLMDLQVGGVSRFSVSKTGNLVAGIARQALFANYQTGSFSTTEWVIGLDLPSATTGVLGLSLGGLGLSQSSSLAWTNGANPNGNAGTVKDLFLFRDAANALAQRNGVNAQTFRLYNTFTDASNYERLSIGWAANVLTISTQNAGTGLQREINLVGVSFIQPPGNIQLLLYNAFNSTSPLISIWGGSAAGDYLRFNTSTLDFYPESSGTWSIGRTATPFRNLFLRDYIETIEMTAPAAPAANRVRIYAEDNGSGKTRLMALFATGAAQQIAIEP